MKQNSNPINSEIQQLIDNKLAVYNQERTPDKGYYCILFPTQKTLYYTLWFHNPDALYYPYIYLSNLELNASNSVSTAIRILSNSYLPLFFVERIENYANNGDDIINFGKYKGNHLQTIYLFDPRYIQWIADKFEAKVKSEFRFKELAESYTKAYLDTQTRKTYKPTQSRHIGRVGDKITNLELTITRVRLEDNIYKTRMVNGTMHFYVDQFITAKDQAGNLYHITLKSSNRSLQTQTLPAGAHAYQVNEKLMIESAKVTKQYTIHNIQYTRIGYIKFIK
ncbi:hypothetical protein LJC57_04860 [Parabacteroides sp. OttesenSCG-928-G07]|nr:hypothetical protein [Parabacteroides sp. OttesenSCG-928-G21]MDL2277905.1 hypothetical protein [Parabacteroides sp. OttesenSCG-928-G07]